MLWQAFLLEQMEVLELQGVLNSITVNGDSSINVKTDMLSDTKDSYWSVNASGGSVSTLIIELAGFEDTNSFGIYDTSNKDNKVTLFERWRL